MLRFDNKNNSDHYTELDVFTLKEIVKNLKALKTKKENRGFALSTAINDTLLELIDILARKDIINNTTNFNKLTFNKVIWMMERETSHRYADSDTTMYAVEHGEGMTILIGKLKNHFN